MKSLFDPITINGVTLANRFVRSATWEGMCEKNGTPTERLQQLYRRLAAGGCGLIVSGYSFVRADGIQLPGTLGIDRDDLVPKLKGLSEAVHEEGGRIFCQLVHVGGQASARVIGVQPLAPSTLESPLYPEPPRELDTGEIAELVEAFAAAARRARDAGFDGVQLHGAHGYLINQFLSPLTNQRSDAYGGSLSNRMRFALEVLDAVRREVGPDYPVTIKLTASDQQPGGFTPEEAVETAAALEEGGIDAVEISSGTAAAGELSPVRQKIDSEEQEAYNAPLAAMIKERLQVPVAVVGGLRSFSVADRLLQKGSADLFALSRPLIREPALVNAWRSDSTHRATCISCNGCFRPGIKEGGIYCVVDKIEGESRTVRI